MGYSRDPAAYPEEFYALFQKAAEEEVKLDLNSKNMAVSMRHRLYAFRRALRETKHHFAMVAYRCEITIDPDVESMVVVRPLGYSLRGLMDKAGIPPYNPVDVPTPTPEPTPEPAPPESDPLGELGFKVGGDLDDTD